MILALAVLDLQSPSSRCPIEPKFECRCSRELWDAAEDCIAELGIRGWLEVLALGSSTSVSYVLVSLYWKQYSVDSLDRPRTLDQSQRSCSVFLGQ